MMSTKGNVKALVSSAAVGMLSACCSSGDPARTESHMVERPRSDSGDAIVVTYQGFGETGYAVFLARGLTLEHKGRQDFIINHPPGFKALLKLTLGNESLRHDIQSAGVTVAFQLIDSSGQTILSGGGPLEETHRTHASERWVCSGPYDGGWAYWYRAHGMPAYVTLSREERYLLRIEARDNDGLVPSINLAVWFDDPAWRELLSR